MARGDSREAKPVLSRRGQSERPVWAAATQCRDTFYSYILILQCSLDALEGQEALRFNKWNITKPLSTHMSNNNDQC